SFEDKAIFNLLKLSPPAGKTIGNDLKIPPGLIEKLICRQPAHCGSTPNHSRIPAMPPLHWFIAMNKFAEPAPKYDQLAKVAIHTALKNTSLVPHLIYDGEPNGFTDWAPSP